tara:strand:+ start:161 stop:1042 length:882 start_codon:yes stop_codon:yes gene_type:complete
MADSKIQFKSNNPVKIESGTGVSLTDNGVPFTSKTFDGLSQRTIRLSIGQEVATSSNVQFATVTLDPSTLIIGSGSNQITIKDGEITGSSITFQNGFVVSESVEVSTNITLNDGIVTSGSSTYTSSSKVMSVDSGSTIFGNSLSNKQHFTGSFDITGSFDLNDIAGNIIEISNDSSLTDESSGSFVTEKAAYDFMSALKPDRDYLRKSFTHTGSFVNSTTSSFNAMTASAPTNLSATSENDFMFFINGMLIENDALTLAQKSSTNLELRLDTDSLGYTLEANDEVIGFGKFDS